MPWKSVFKMKNPGKATYILQFEATLEEFQELKEEFSNDYTGVRGAFKAAIRDMIEKATENFENMWEAK